MVSFYSILAILVLLSFAFSAYATGGVGIITTVAGSGNVGYSGDNGPATSADLNTPHAVHVDTAGNIFIADSYNNLVRKVDPNGVITTIAGMTGIYGYNGDDIAATSASLNLPHDVTSDTLGNIYIVDRTNERIRKVDANGVITTIAGNGNLGFNGDNIAATTASLARPSSITFDKAGNLYIADTWNSRIRKVDVNGIITTVAGPGNYVDIGDGGAATDAAINYPDGVSTDSSGNIYILENHRIRKVDVNGIITTVVGTGTYGFSGDGGAAADAQISYPERIAFDAFGNLYIADSSNNRIRKVDVNGIITTVAGTGIQGYNGDGGAAADALLSNPYFVTTDKKGNLYIADTFNSRIRKVTFPEPPTVEPTFMPTARSTTAKPIKAKTTKNPSFKPTNKPTKKKTAAPSRRPTKKPTKKPTK